MLFKKTDPHDSAMNSSLGIAKHRNVSKDRSIALSALCSHELKTCCITEHQTVKLVPSHGCVFFGSPFLVGFKGKPKATLMTPDRIQRWSALSAKVGDSPTIKPLNDKHDVSVVFCKTSSRHPNAFTRPYVYVYRNDFASCSTSYHDVHLAWGPS